MKKIKKASSPQIKYQHLGNIVVGDLYDTIKYIDSKSKPTESEFIIVEVTRSFTNEEIQPGKFSFSGFLVDLNVDYDFDIISVQNSYMFFTDASTGGNIPFFLNRFENGDGQYSRWMYVEGIALNRFSEDTVSGDGYYSFKVLIKKK